MKIEQNNTFYGIDRMSKAITQLFMDNHDKDSCYLHAMLLSKFERLENNNIPTMGVGLSQNKCNVVLYYNQEFVNKLNPEELKGVLLHEADHIVNCHFDRGDGKEHKIWNIATDMAINQLSVNSGFTLPKGAVFPFDGMQKVREAEYYYEKLSELGEEILEDLETIDDHSLWEEIANDPMATEILKDVVREVAQKGLECGIKAGAEWLDILAKKSKKNWKRELRAFFQPTKFDISYRFNRFDKRRTWPNGSEMIPARTNRVEKHSVFVAVDVSGSITDLDIENFMGEVLKIKDDADVTLLIFDTTIHLETTKIDTKINIKGRGGTCFQPVLDRLAEKKDGRNLVVLTDGFASTSLKMPKRSKVMWAITPGGNTKGFVGKVINLHY